MEKFLVFFGFFIFASSANASLNPAVVHELLRFDQPIVVEFGLEYMHEGLPAISNVVVENTATSTAVSGPVRGTVSNNYPDIFAQTLFVEALVDPASRFTVGLKTYLPLNGLTQIDTGNTYQPEFALYRTEAQRPRVLLLSGMDFNSDWRVGLGLDVAFSVDAQANIFLQSGTGTVSDQRISGKVKPSFVPQGTLVFQNYELTYRGENKAVLDLSTQAGARIFSSTSAGIDFAYSSQSALYYEPASIDLAGKNTVNSSLAIDWSLAYQFWNKYQARAAVIQSSVPVNCNGNSSCTPLFASGSAPAFTARNLIVPTVSSLWSLGDDTLSIGYRFKDSIFSGTPSGTGNYLDPPRHDALLGYTHRTAKGWEWKFTGQVSRLASQTVVKSDPSSIGGPSYSVSGWLYGGGASVVIPFKN